MTDPTTSALRQEGPQQELRRVIDREIDEILHASGSKSFNRVREESTLAIIAALSASRTAQQQETEDEDELHTGDDERLDAVTSIVAGLEAMRDDPEANADITFDSLIEDCTALDALLLATIKRERGASRTAQEGQQEEKDMDETPKFDDPSEGPFEFAWFCRHNGEPILTVADVVETVALSADKSTRAELFGVCLAERDEDGQQIVVCYTGNGPRSEVNARLIARLLSDYRTTAPTPRSAESFGLKPEMQPVVDELRRRMALPSSPAEGEKEDK